MVATARVDGAIIDANVYEYLRTTDKLHGIDNKVQLGRRVLAEPKLYIAFQQTQEGKRWLSILNEGLSLINTQALLDSYWQNLSD